MAQLVAVLTALGDAELHVVLGQHGLGLGHGELAIMENAGRQHRARQEAILADETARDGVLQGAAARLLARHVNAAIAITPRNELGDGLFVIGQGRGGGRSVVHVHLDSGRARFGRRPCNSSNY